MSDPNIKQIKLVGGTGIEMGGGEKKGKTKKAAKKYDLGHVTKEGGGGTSPGTITQLVTSRATNAPGPTPPAPVGLNSPLTQVGAPVLAGGKAAATPVKVVLGALKKQNKVVLAAAAKKSAAPAATTRKNKVARKVRVSMVSLSRKIGKAKDIRTKASGDKIEEVKKALEKAGLIKPESKAPETMLRQMYADFMMLKKRAL